MTETSGAFAPLVFEGWMYDYTLVQIGICEALVGLFLAISFFWNITHTVAKSYGAKPININLMIRGLVIAFALPFYIPLAYVVFEVLDLIRQYTVIDGLGDIIVDAAKAAKQNSLQVAAENKAQELGWFDEMAAMGEFGYSWLKGGLLRIVNSPLEGVKIVIRSVIQSLTKVLIVIFFVLGPYSWVFSILPSFENKLEQWFKTYFTLCFVPITFNVIEGIYHMLFKDVLTNSTMVGGWFEIFALGVVFIIVYTLPFWITGKIVGSADAGRFLSQTVQIASTAMKPRLSKASNQKSGTSSPNSVGNVASASSDAMSK